MRKIAVLNQKGGVGKTTIAANLSHALAMAGQKIIAVDLDPQGHLSASLGIFKPPKHGIADVMQTERSLASVQIDTREGLHLVPAGLGLRDMEDSGEKIKDKMGLLKSALSQASESSDFVILDCPPSSGLIAANAIMAVDEILIPVSGDYLSLNGLAHLLITLKRFDPIRSKPLKKKIVLSRFVARRRLSQEVLEKLQEHFPGMILQTPVREASILAECPGVGRTVFEYRENSGSAEDFKMLAHDIMHGNTMS